MSKVLINQKLALESNKYKKNLMHEIKKHKYLIILLVPALIWYIIFCYVPMYGNIMAFKQYNFRLGIFGSPWVGFQKFERAFSDPGFWLVFKNQIVISLMMLLITFPLPIIFSFMLNELRGNKLKRFFQTAYTFPHFLSWIVVAGIFFNILSYDGIYNQISTFFGGSTNDILMNQKLFRGFLYFTQAWKETGWGTIIYLAALAGINPELYQAASIDGANRYQQMLNITWPGLKSTVTVLFILAVGSVLSTGFDQIVNLYNPTVFKVADIVDTYIYRSALIRGDDYSYMAAIGLFKSVINLVLLAIANYSTRFIGEEGIF